MAEAAIRHTNAATRALRTLDGWPAGPIWLFVALLVAIDGAFLVWTWAFGYASEVLIASRDPLTLHVDGRVHLVIGALTAFLLATRRNERRGMRRELAELRPHTGLGEAQYEELIGSDLDVTPGQSAMVAVFALTVGTLMIPLTSETPTSNLVQLLDGRYWDAHFAWAFGANIAVFGLMALGIFEHRGQRRVLHRVAQHIHRIELLDRRGVAPFARQGLRSAFLWAGASSITSLIAIQSQVIWPLLVILAITLGMATLALIGPAQAIRQRIRDAKHAELARVRAKIAEARDAALGDGGGGAAEALPGLLAYEARIETVREWPFDTPTLARFAALAVLATGSWLGGALVERLLGFALD